MPVDEVLVDDMLVDVFFGGLFSELEDLIETARRAVDGILLQAGIEAYNAVQNAKNAYLDILDKTMEQLNNATRDILLSLQSLVNSVLEKTFNNLDDLAIRLQAFANTLPLANLMPQVTRVTPRYIVPQDQDDDVELTVHGNFVKAERPYLEEPRGGERFELLENLDPSLKFNVPVSHLPWGFVGPNEVNMATLKLTVPWDSSSIPILGDWAEREFNILIKALPPTLGDIRVEHTVSHDQTVTELYESEVYHQYSVNESYIDKTYQEVQHDPWRVVQGSFLFSPPPGTGPLAPGLKNEGVWSFKFVSDDGNRVVWTVTTRYHPLVSNFSGKIDFQVSFKREKTVPRSETISEDVDLHWGGVKRFQFPPGTKWTVFYKPFDADEGEAELQFAVPPNPEDRFLKIAYMMGTLTLSTAKPATLKWPD